MPNKKITVVGDGAEQPLTPEEEHRLEVRVDQMLDPALPDSAGTPLPIIEQAVAVAAPEPPTPPAPKPVTKIVPKFADEDDEPAAEPAETQPEPPVETPAPKPKPAAKKINVIHHEDEPATDEVAAPEESATEPVEAPVAPKKSTKSTAKTKKADKPKKPAAKKPKPDDNLDSKADAIAAAALVAAEQMDAKHETPEIESPELPAADTGPVDETPEVPEDLPTADESANSTQGAPPLIQKHAAAPIGTETAEPTEEAEAAEPLASPATSKKISIVDNSGIQPEVADTDGTTDAEPAPEVAKEVVAEEEPATEADQPAEVADTKQLVEEVETPETPELTEPEAEAVPAETEPEATAEADKKYRPPEGAIQFKRAETPIEPFKPGSGPRSAEADDLASEDAAIAQAFETKEAPRAKRAAPKVSARGAKKVLLTLFVVLILAAVASFLVPSVRNSALAVVGAKADVQVAVIDATTHTPLTGATVTSGGVSASTGVDGIATLHGVKLGNQQVSVQKYAFATKAQSVNVAWHSTNATAVPLTTTGQHYKFTVTDYVSGLPVAGAKISSGQATSLTNAKGASTLVAPSGNPTVTVAAAGYTASQTTAETSDTANVVLVPAGNDVYISRSAGKFNVYKNTVDGKHEQLLLADAGATASDMAIATSSTGISALVSTRDNTRDAAGNIQDSLTLITTASGATSVVDHADSIKLVDWYGTRVVYVLIKTTTSTTDDTHYQIVSYDTASKTRTIVDHMAYLNDIMSAKGMVYYATAANGNSTGQFVSVQPDGKGKKVILPNEIAAINRTSYNLLSLSSVNKWYTYRLGSAQAVPTATAVSTTSRQYVDSPNGMLSVYIDSSSTPKLVLYNAKTGKETQLTQATGITYPVHWLGNGNIVYRISHSGVVTDNVVSPAGGTAKAITNVSDIAGISLWNQ